MALSFVLQNLDAIPVLLASIEMKQMNVKGENVKGELVAFWMEKANEWATVARASLERRCVEIEEIMDSIERKCVEGNATWKYRVQKKQLMEEIDVEAPKELWWIDTIDKNFSTLVEVEISYSSFKKVEYDGSYLSHMLVQFIDPSNFTGLDLRKAVRNQNLAFVNHFLLNTRLTNRECSDALHLAAERGYVSIVRSLIADGRCLSGGFNGGEALGLASYYGHLSVVESLLADPRVDASLNSYYSSAIKQACFGNNSLILTRLLQVPGFYPFNSNVLDMLYKILIDMTAMGFIDIMDILLKLRDPSGFLYLDPSSKNNIILNLAVQNSHLAVINRLLEDPRIDPSIDNNNTLSLALYFYERNNFRSIKQQEIVDRLLAEPRVQQELRKRYSPRIIKKIEAGYLPNVLRVYHHFQ